MIPSNNLDGPRVLPPQGKAAAQLIVLLHGYGADGEDLITLAPVLQQYLPRAAIVAPNAPDAIPNQPFGRQWFSLDRYDPDLLRRDPVQAPEIFREMELGAETAAAALQQFLDQELARLGLGAERLILVGFSQGTMMALQIGLRRSIAPAGILGFSGALLGLDRLKTELRSRPPVLLIHGDADEIVPIEAMFSAAHGLAELQVPVRWHICAGLGHGIDADGLAEAGQALSQWADRVR